MAFKFEDVTVSGWILLGVLLVCALGLAWIARSKQKWTPQMMANAAICMALSFVLSYIRLFKMPQGGSITPASMLPLIAFSVACGPLQGTIVGCAYGLLELIQDPYVIHPIQMLVDYPVAFGVLALGGMVCFIPMKKQFKLPVAVLLGSSARYLMAVLSGTVFFAEYALSKSRRKRCNFNEFIIFNKLKKVSFLLPRDSISFHTIIHNNGMKLKLKRILE